MLLATSATNTVEDDHSALKGILENLLALHFNKILFPIKHICIHREYTWPKSVLYAANLVLRLHFYVVTTSGLLTLNLFK